VTGAVDIASQYQIADAQLELSSPLVAGLTTTLDSVLTQAIGSTLDAAVGPEGLLGSALAAADLNLSVLGLATVDVSTGTIGVDGVEEGVDALIQQLLLTPLQDEAGIASIDLANGQITVDLQRISYAEGTTGLNGLPANTSLLNAATLTAITDAVAEALGTRTARVQASLAGLIGNLSAQVELGAELDLLFGVLPAADITLEGRGRHVERHPGRQPLPDDPGRRVHRQRRAHGGRLLDGGPLPRRLRHELRSVPRAQSRPSVGRRSGVDGAQRS
jgi:hypothetical protein